MQVDATGSLSADGQGYAVQAGPGAGNGGYTNNGGSYGGLGGGQAASTTYGSATAPVDLGSGGDQYSGTGGAGGGAIELLVSGTLTNNGVVSANGAGAMNIGGGGSGGSIYVIANMLAGTGTFTANGGANPSPSGGGGNGGGGGRVAAYYVANGGFSQTGFTASGGPAGTVAGAAGTVEIVNAPTSAFVQPTGSVIHGTATIQWFTDTGASTTVKASGPETLTVATAAGDVSTSSWDTTQVPDGAYQLQLTVLDAGGNVLQQVSKAVVVNNSVQWYSGTLTANTHWTASNVYALDGDLVIPSGVTLMIDPGTVVKALPGAEIIVQTGGTLTALGGVDNPVIFTTFDDYTAGGDTDFNQGVSVPSPGEWSGIDVAGGTFSSNGNTVIRYVQAYLSGSLSSNTTLYSTQVYIVSGTLVVPSEVTLTIQPGTVLKFASGAGMDVQPGATLTANGTLAQPIYFTSANDSSIGGDTSGTGGTVAPAPGDWNSIILDGATVSLQHVQMQYGGGPLNSGAQAGMIETTDNANVTITDSTLASSYAIGIQTGYPNGGGDTVTVTNTTFYSNEDRAINAYPGSVVHAVNDTFDSNAAGVMAHGGTVDVENSVVSNSSSTQFGGIALCCGGNFTSIANTDVYTSATGVPNYAGLTDPTGTNANVSANPVYMNGPQHDYRPTYGSPLIDAANATVPNYPSTDAFGMARYNAPLVTTKTGTPDANGLYPDIGAFEFTQSAPSNLDFTVSSVSGPQTATVGTQVTVNWTVTNIGTGTAYGPWHDAVYLVTDPGTNPIAVVAGQMLEGQGVVLGPGASYSASGSITVPGTTIGDHRWEVKTNVLGEVFEGANTANNTGIALGTVGIDLTQLVPGAAPLNGSFAGTGLSSYYKVIPDATQTTKVQLALASGVSGSVQLFIGGGYVPTPQHYDYQQVEFNSTTASVVIPSGSAQTYYVTAYAQTIPVSPAAYTIQATSLQFSLTSVSPSNVTTGGSSTLTFTGGGFASNTVFSLVASNGTVYSPTATFLSASDQASVTFSFTGVPTGVYTAQASNGSTVTLANALTVVAASGPGSGGSGGGIVAGTGTGQVNVWLELPEAFRAGFPSVVTLHYQNVSGYDVPAPLIYVSAQNATLSEIAPACSGCDPNLAQKYGNTFNSGVVLGISQQGPAGILPAGASGSIQFLANPGSSGDASFSASATGSNLVQPVIGEESGSCSSITGSCFYPVIIQEGSYAHGTDFCSSLAPTGASSEGFTRTCLALLNKLGFTYVPLPANAQPITTNASLVSISPIPYSRLTLASFNQLLAADATALSAAGDYEYDVQRLLAYELQSDGLGELNTRYHRGAFGFGLSHPFDITLSTNTFAPTIHYPDGATRVFEVVSPTQSNLYLGAVGDYGTVTVQSDGSYVLTEADGTLYHFPAGATASTPLDYIQDRNGNRTTMTSSGGLITSIVDALGNTISYKYDAYGHIVNETDQVGRITTFAYDILNDTSHSAFLTSIVDASGTTTFTWNEGGSSGVGYINDSCVQTYCEAPIGIASVTYSDGSHTYFQYDSVGRLIGQNNDGGTQSRTITYNGDGSVSLADANGQSSTFMLNASGSTLSLLDPLGNMHHLQYDPEGKLLSALGPLGDSTRLSYDSMDNIASLASPVGNTTNMNWAADNSLLSLTDPNGNATSYAYSGNFDPIALTSPNGAQVKASVDQYGRLISKTNLRGNTISFTYTANGLPLTKTYANGTQVTYSYDGHGNLQTATSAAGTTSMTYDAADRLASLTNPDGTSLRYTYNAANQRSSMTDSTGFVTNYQYDAVGRLASLTNASGAVIVSYTHDANGRLASKTLGNGTTSLYTYDARGNLLSLINRSPANATLSEYDYTYDSEGHPLTMSAPGGTSTYSYDLDEQMVSVAMPTATIQYTYDAAGNRSSVTKNGAASTYQVNNLNEYTAAGNAAYQYDLDGNMTAGNGWTYTYDDENHLLTMVNATDSWSFQYDGLGYRISSTHNGTVTRYLTDPTNYGNLEAEFTGGQLSAHYIHGLDLISSVQANGTASYYHYDGTGNTTQLTNAAGTVVNSYSYSPFGEQTVLSSGVPNPFTYGGATGVRDDGTGLYFMRNRYYNPTLGRFQQQDPLGLEGGRNFYEYASNSPISRVDPLGLRDVPILSDGTVWDPSKAAPIGSFPLDPDYAVVSGAAGVSVGHSVNLYDNSGHTSLGAATGAGANVSFGWILAPTPAGQTRAEFVSGFLDGRSYNASAYTGVGGGVTWSPGSTFWSPGTFSLEGGFGVGGRGGAGGYGTSLDAGVQSWFQGLNYLTNGALFGTQRQGVPLAYIPPPNIQICGNCILSPTPPFYGPIDKPIDPNGKLTSGYGDSGFVPAGAPINYTIYFENQPTATLSAQKVTVTDPLAANLDWSTVQFSQVAFNNVTLNLPPGTQNYTAQANVSTDPNPVNVAAAINPATGVITWTMQSVDPVTGGAPANPLSGFLPPNNSANAGAGYVTFSVMPKAGLANGTSITNQGSIVFDVNPAIATNTVTNTIDTSSVTSSINSMPTATTATALNVSWTGSDPTGSGIASYNIYVAIDSGAYSLWLSATTLTSSTYNALPGHSYSFSSLATNNVGIVQTTASAPQTITVNYMTPFVTVTPASSNIAAGQPLAVAIAVAAPSGGTTVPTGTVTLATGTYTSAAVALSNGVTSITVPASALANGIDVLTAAYTPDASGALLFNSATGMAQVTVGTPAVPTGTLSPSSLAFTATSGSTSAVQTAQLTNTGTTAISISGVTLTGTGATSFAETSACGTSLAAGSNCTISITFTPPSVGSFSAALSIADNASVSPQTVSLTGTGTAAPTFQLSATPGTQSVLAGSDASYTISVNPQGGTFTSTVALTASGLPSGATAAFTPAIVTPGSAAVTSTLNIQTPKSFAGMRPFGGSSTRPILALVGFLFLAIRKRRRVLLLSVLLLVSFAGIGSIMGCGSSPQTAPRSYTITVTGTSGSQTQTANLTLTLHD